MLFSFGGSLLSISIVAEGVVTDWCSPLFFLLVLLCSHTSRLPLALPPHSLLHLFHLINSKVAGAPVADSEAILRHRGGGAAWRAAECERGEQPPAAAPGSEPSAASGGSDRSQSAARDHTAHQREPGRPLHTWTQSKQATPAADVEGPWKVKYKQQKHKIHLPSSQL